MDAAATDPYVLLRFGEMKTRVTAAETVLEHAVETWLRAAENVSRRKRDDACVATAEAKVVAGDAALKVSGLLFGVCGAGAVQDKYNLGRHWRNARTLTLHDPTDYKLRLIGDHVLNGTSPPVSGYT